ncbi:hypothetical protein HRU87_05335 [Aquiluna borgnonia]|uniref:Uncharacterized protein n=1 Tax=Aquiluna borgnonia TaxID=2499157 RepID=A0A7D4TRV3_9MICO|nr:hypothetical protein [Aquiluna borgnonia]QKJ25593.1 hypothetical protein HRU87_05335 [Aquiluna borgnonia]
MENTQIELTESQMLADIHNMLSDIHEAMFAEDDELAEEESEEESEDEDDADSN